jgi:hypothetical protein
MRIDHKQWMCRNPLIPESLALPLRDLPCRRPTSAVCSLNGRLLQPVMKPPRKIQVSDGCSDGADLAVSLEFLSMLEAENLRRLYV